MPRNVAVTGPPRSGKTTVLERLVARLREDGHDVGGVLSPERRVDGRRVGFGVRTLGSGRKRTMASVDRATGPRVGKYRLDPDAVAAAAREAFGRAAAPEDASAAPGDDPAVAGDDSADSGDDSADDRAAGWAPAGGDPGPPADVLVVDEVGPMQARVDAFVAGLRRALAGPTPVVAAAAADDGGLPAEVRGRPDVEVRRVTPATRDALPAELAAVLGRWIGPPEG